MQRLLEHYAIGNVDVAAVGGERRVQRVRPWSRSLQAARGSAGPRRPARLPRPPGSHRTPAASPCARDSPARSGHSRKPSDSRRRRKGIPKLVFGRVSRIAPVGLNSVVAMGATFVKRQSSSRTSESPARRTARRRDPGGPGASAVPLAAAVRRRRARAGVVPLPASSRSLLQPAPCRSRSSRNPFSRARARLPSLRTHNTSAAQDVHVIGTM